MARIRFFPPSSAPSLAEVASWCGATLAADADPSRVIRDVAALDQAGPGDLTFLDNPRYLDALKRTQRGGGARFAALRRRGARDLRRAHRPRALPRDGLGDGQALPFRGQAGLGFWRDRDFPDGVGSPFGAARDRA